MEVTQILMHVLQTMTITHKTKHTVQRAPTSLEARSNPSEGEAILGITLGRSPAIGDVWDSAMCCRDGSMPATSSSGDPSLEELLQEVLCPDESGDRFNSGSLPDSFAATAPRRSTSTTSYNWNNASKWARRGGAQKTNMQTRKEQDYWWYIRGCRMLQALTVFALLFELEPVSRGAAPSTSVSSGWPRATAARPVSWKLELILSCHGELHCSIGVTVQSSSTGSLSIKITVCMHINVQVVYSTSHGYPRG